VMADSKWETENLIVWTEEGQLLKFSLLHDLRLLLFTLTSTNSTLYSIQKSTGRHYCIDVLYGNVIILIGHLR
jgi:hypothetical protein